MSIFPSICESFSHERTCNCQEYTSPSLTITKIGLAFHVKFALKDGSYSFIDCDINIPTIPTSTRYDGSISSVSEFLMGVQPVGWLEEFDKLEDMIRSSYMSHLIGADSWQVKMRMINRDTVLPRQVGTKMQCFDDNLSRACSFLETILLKASNLTSTSSSKS